MLKLVTVAQCAGCRGYANMRCECRAGLPWYCCDCYGALEHETWCREAA